MELKKIGVLEFLSDKITPWPNLRSINVKWVAELKKQQLSYITTIGEGNPIIPGSFIVAIVSGISYLIDGQHRLRMLNEMHNEGVSLNGVYLSIEVYDCGGDIDKASAIYNMTNNRYNAKAITIDDIFADIIGNLLYSCRYETKTASLAKHLILLQRLKDDSLSLTEEH